MLLIGKKPWGYHAYLPCLRFLSPLFTVPISLVYDAYFPCLRFYFARLMTDSRIFEPTFLYRVHAWYAWLTDGRAVYSVKCLRVM